MRISKVEAAADSVPLPRIISAICQRSSFLPGARTSALSTSTSLAVNATLHSYRILAAAGSEKAAEDVGFYYAANAAGRLGGTLLSGLFYQWGGMAFCLGGSAAMLLVCWVITFLLPGATARARASAT